MTDTPNDHGGRSSPDDSAQDRLAGRDLLPEHYDELRVLASQRLAKLGRGQSLQATELVHEAYLRLGHGDEPKWDNDGHFFAAAAQAMRNVIVDRARARNREKRGGDWGRVTLSVVDPESPQETTLSDNEIVSLDGVLRRFEEEQGADRAEIALMRVFAGMTIDQIAAAKGVSSRTINREWRFARAWIQDALEQEESDG